jgi:protein-S-isoprenylcysteine O-methyltransferase Ste14
MLVRLVTSLLGLMLALAAFIFVPAGTIDFWQAWLFLGCYLLASFALSLWLLRNDRMLLERRLRGGPFAETEPSQKIIMAITSLGFLGLLVVPGLDRRFGWSHMPNPVAILGDFLLLAGWAGIAAVFRANSFASATVQVAAGQKVISTGPYGLVRHPMYAAALLMLAGIPISLGSWWGIVVLAAILPALVWRLLDEERVLLRDLGGYADYRRQVPWRLIPKVW